MERSDILSVVTKAQQEITVRSFATREFVALEIRNALSLFQEMSKPASEGHIRGCGVAGKLAFSYCESNLGAYTTFALRQGRYFAGDDGDTQERWGLIRIQAPNQIVFTDFDNPESVIFRSVDEAITGIALRLVDRGDLKPVSATGLALS